MSGLDVEARRAFLAERRTGIGGSDIAALAGSSPYASPWSVWAAKVGLVPLEDSPSPAMQFGTDLEPLIGSWFTARTGLTVGGAQTLVRHRRAPWAMAHLDGYVYDGPEGDPDTTALGVFEAKYSGDGWAELPYHYWLQVQWQLHVTGLEHGWVAALLLPFGRPRFEVYEVAADHDEARRLHDLGERFWLEHVLAGVAPPADGSRATADAITAAYGHHATVKLPTIDLDDEAELVHEFSELKKQERAIEALLKRRANELRARFGRAEAPADVLAVPSEGLIDGELAVSWRSQARTDLDAKAVRADHGDRYDVRSTVRVLRLHGRYQP